MNTDDLLNKSHPVPIFNAKQLFQEITGSDISTFDEEALLDNEEINED